MPDEKTGQPAVQQPEPTETKEQEETSTQLELLPDDVPVTDEKKEADKIAELAKREKEELTARLQKTEEEKNLLEKRLRDNQEYISRTRNIEKETEPQRQIKTFDEYLSDIEKIVDKEFEDDPKKGLKSVVKKIVTDVAYDRDLERREMERRITEAEDKALKRVMALDPEKNKVIKDMEKLDEDHPALKGLTFEQKLEILHLGGEKKPEPNVKLVERERELAGDAGGGKYGATKEKLPGWANDPEVSQKAHGHFASKKEMIMWGNSKTAIEIAKKFRNNPA